MLNTLFVKGSYIHERSDFRYESVRGGETMMLLFNLLPLPSHDLNEILV